MKNILILSNSLPDGGWGGGVIIRSLTQGHPAGCRFFWTTFHLKKENEGQSVNGIDVVGFRARHFRGRGISDAVLAVESRFFVKDFNALLKKHQIDLLWIVLGTSYDQLYRISKLCDGLCVPYHVSVHDDPVLEIKASKKNKGTRFFGNILRKAAGIDVISQRMQAQYQKDFGVRSIVVTRCIPDDFPKHRPGHTAEKTILMGGYGNASAPWPLPLIEAVDRLNAQGDFTLHLFDPKLKPYQNGQVRVHDLVSESTFNEMLKSTDLGYACDDLSPEKLSFAQLSLPTKVITYIGAGIPFVYHGPRDSTVGDLLRKYEAGLIVDNNDAAELSAAFLKLLSGYGYFQNNCRLASENLFSQKKVQKEFFDLLLKA